MKTPFVVYVSGPRGEWPYVAKVMDECRRSGLAVPYDWTEHVEADEKNRAAPTLHARCVEIMGALQAADAVLALTDGPCKERSVEIGVALGLGKPVVTAGEYPDHGIWTEQCAHMVVSSAAAITLLGRMRAERSVQPEAVQAMAYDSAWRVQHSGRGEWGEVVYSRMEARVLFDRTAYGQDAEDIRLYQLDAAAGAWRSIRVEDL